MAENPAIETVIEIRGQNGTGLPKASFALCRQVTALDRAELNPPTLIDVGHGLKSGSGSGLTTEAFIAGLVYTHYSPVFRNRTSRTRLSEWPKIVESNDPENFVDKRKLEVDRFGYKSLQYGLSTGTHVRLCRGKPADADQP